MSHGLSITGACFKVFVGRVFIAIHLHLGYMALLWGSDLVHFHKATAIGGPLRALADHDDSHHNDNEHSDAAHGNAQWGASADGALYWRALDVTLHTQTHTFIYFIFLNLF